MPQSNTPVFILYPIIFPPSVQEFPAKFLGCRRKKQNIQMDPMDRPRRLSKLPVPFISSYRYIYRKMDEKRESRIAPRASCRYISSRHPVYL